jgi:hypothetical protein
VRKHYQETEAGVSLADGQLCAQFQGLRLYGHLAEILLERPG